MKKGLRDEISGNLGGKPFTTIDDDVIMDKSAAAHAAGAQSPEFTATVVGKDDKFIYLKPMSEDFSAEKLEPKMTRLKQFLDFSGQEKVTVIKIKRQGTEGVDQHGRVGEDITMSYRQRPTKGREAIDWKGPREIRPASRKEVFAQVPVSRPPETKESNKRRAEMQREAERKAKEATESQLSQKPEGQKKGPHL